jgi:hypothetical protein
MIDVETGEVSTFSTNTVGGDIAVGELADQVAFMRRVRPDAIPVIALESKDMPTKFGGTKPRPYFKILGWRGRSETDTSAGALPAPRSTVQLQRDNYEAPPWVRVEKPSLTEELNDDLPSDLAPPKSAKPIKAKAR